MEKVKLVVLKYFVFENRDLYFLMDFLVFSPWKDSNAKKNIGTLLLKLSRKWKLSTEILMKNLNHVVLVRNEFQHSGNLKLEIIYN